MEAVEYQVIQASLKVLPRNICEILRVKQRELGNVCQEAKQQLKMAQNSVEVITTENDSMETAQAISNRTKLLLTCYHCRQLGHIQWQHHCRPPYHCPNNLTTCGPRSDVLWELLANLHAVAMLDIRPS